MNIVSKQILIILTLMISVGCSNFMDDNSEESRSKLNRDSNYSIASSEINNVEAQVSGNKFVMLSINTPDTKKTTILSIIREEKSGNTIISREKVALLASIKFEELKKLKKQNRRLIKSGERFSQGLTYHSFPTETIQVYDTLPSTNNTFIYKVNFLKCKKNKKTRKVRLIVLKGKTMISNELIPFEDHLLPEYSVSDGDGVGDNADAFPDDATRQYPVDQDTDGDGVSDGADVDGYPVVPPPNNSTVPPPNNSIVPPPNNSNSTITKY